MTQPTGLKIIDIYHNDAVESFHDIKASGVVGVYIKASQGTAVIDSAHMEFYNRARSVGLIAGFYHFFDPEADPIAQANHFLSVAPHATGDFLHCLDIETAGANVKYSHGTAMRIKAMTNRWPVIYSGDSFYQDNLKNVFPVGFYHLWIARYGAKPVTPCDLWQWSENARTPGVTNPGDADVFDGDADMLANWRY